MKTQKKLSKNQSNGENLIQMDKNYLTPFNKEIKLVETLD
jgi:hypothetical protein